ncbi:MAG: leucyl/phenylalanyl-tRNA--protein transferase [Litoreibacter sp.]
MSLVLTPGLILNAYSRGIFPMAEGRDDPEIYWLDPKRRGVIPLDNFHMSRSLRKKIRREPYDIKVNTDFSGVLEGCADRDETWINDQIFSLYMDLHRSGHAHSVEVWEGTALIGGIYGVTLASAFFGESMFSRKRDTSKIAMAYLVSRLRKGGFSLFDTQFITDHLASMGGIEISRDAYHVLLTDALKDEASFHQQPPRVSADQVCNE